MTVLFARRMFCCCCCIIRPCRVYVIVTGRLGSCRRKGEILCQPTCHRHVLTMLTSAGLISLPSVSLQTTGGSQRTVAGVAGVDPTTARRRSRIFDVLPDLMPLLDGDHTSPSGHGASGKLLLQVKELRHDLEESQRENMRLKV